MERLKMLVLNFNFVMIRIIHKMSVLIKINLNYFKGSIFECFFKNYNRVLIFFITYDNGKFKSSRRKHN